MNVYQPISVDFECLNGKALEYGKPAQQAMGLDSPVEDLYVFQHHQEIVTMIGNLSNSKLTAVSDSDIESFIQQQDGSVAQKSALTRLMQNSIDRLESAYKDVYEPFEARIEAILPKGTVLKPHYNIGINTDNQRLCIDGCDFMHKFRIELANIPEEIRVLVVKFLKVIEYHGNFSFALDGYCNFVEEEVFFDVKPTTVDNIVSTIATAANIQSLQISDFIEDAQSLLEEYIEQSGCEELCDCIEDLQKYTDLLIARRTLNDIKIADYQQPLTQINDALDTLNESQDVLSKYPQYQELMITVLHELNRLSDDGQRLYDAVDIDNSGDAPLMATFFVELGLSDSESHSVENAFQHLMQTGEESLTALYCNDDTLLPYLLKISFVKVALTALEAFTNP